MTDATVTCPRCEGRRGGNGFTTYADGTCTFGWIVCSLCKGSGQVESELIARIEQGEAIRAARVARGETQREAAVRLGISVAEYSAIEHGTGPIPPEALA